VIDTTELSPARLRRLIAEDFLTPETRGKLSLTFMTFGFKHGPPRNVDPSFDVRFLPNPHYVPELRDHTGLEDDVREYVDEGKQHLTIGIGCTGGKHRSVVIAEQLAGIYRGSEGFTVDVTHRDIDNRPRP
jgi:RNase adapter protein RapZ